MLKRQKSFQMFEETNQMLLTEKAAASVAETAVVTTTSATATDPMTNALELQLQNEERREEEAVAQKVHNLRENREGEREDRKSKNTWGEREEWGLMSEKRAWARSARERERRQRELGGKNGGT